MDLEEGDPSGQRGGDGDVLQREHRPLVLEHGVEAVRVLRREEVLGAGL